MGPARNNGFYRGRDGLAFRNGKLYDFSKRVVVVMRLWPAPMAWVKTAKGGWQHTRSCADATVSDGAFFRPPVPPAPLPRPFALPNGQLVLPGITTAEWLARKAHAADCVRVRCVATIPEEVRSEVARYRTRCWNMLSLLARCPGALDLSRANPALAYALANNWAFHKPAVARPLRAARSLVRRPQHAIQAWLGFAPTEPVRRLLAKIEPEALTMRRLLFLRRALERPATLELLRHLPHTSHSALELVAQHRLRRYVSPRLLLDVLEYDANHPLSEPHHLRGDLACFVDLTRHLASLGGVTGWPRPFQSLAEVVAIHADLAPRIGVELLCDHPDGEDFPPPPFAGTPDIVPITDTAALYREGREQQNCVGTYALRVFEQRVYVYRVERPVRGTLAVVNHGTRWVVSEFRQARNQPVPAETARRVCAELVRT